MHPKDIGGGQKTPGDPRLDELEHRLEQKAIDDATAQFRKKYQDLTEEDDAFLIQWVQNSTDKLRDAGWTYSEILEQAYSNLILSRKGSQSAITDVTEDHDVPPTQPRKKGPTIHMTPAERQKVAMEVFLSNDTKKKR